MPQIISISMRVCWTHLSLNPTSDNIPEARDGVEFSIHAFIRNQFAEMRKPQTVAVAWLRPGMEEDQSSRGINRAWLEARGKIRWFWQCSQHTQAGRGSFFSPAIFCLCD